jgi:hypothetical protein
MKQRTSDVQTTAPDSYWTHNLVIGEGDVQRHNSLIRLHLHRSEEPYFHSEELFPIASHLPGNRPPRGATRTYFHAKPFILIPQMTLTIGLTRPKVDSREIGRVIGSDVKHLQEQEIGNAQAWYYPTDKALVLWECYLFELYRKDDPLKDPLLATLWQGFEDALLKELPDTTRIYTTYEPIYERPVFKTFLRKRQYRPIEKVAFVKEVT